MIQLWTERYRPRSLDEVVGHDEVKEELRGYIETRTLPHLLFHGEPGCGKTSIAYALAREYLREAFSVAFLELNASDDRGIDTVRDTIKKFCKTVPLIGDTKILLLDEADYTTPEFQAALRRSMEKYPTARFILTANDVARISKAILSRCRTIELKPLDEYDIVKRLREIVRAEGVEVDDWRLYEIAEESQGDLRAAINRLQAECAKVGVQMTLKW